MDDLRRRCSCGHSRDESTAKDEHGRPQYDYDVHSDVCYACEAIAAERRRIQKDGGEAAMDGRIFFATEFKEDPHG